MGMMNPHEPERRHCPPGRPGGWRLRAGVIACAAAVLLASRTFAFHTGDPACDRALAEALKHGHLSVTCPPSDGRPNSGRMTRRGLGIHVRRTMGQRDGSTQNSLPEGSAKCRHGRSPQS